MADWTLGKGSLRAHVIVSLLFASTLVLSCGDPVDPRRGDDPDLEDPWYGPHELFDGGALVISPSPLVFEVVDIGVPVVREISLTNRGQDGLVVFRLGPQGGRGRDIEVTDPDLPIGLAVGETKTVTLTYTPQSCDSSEASLRVYWSNKESSRLELPIETTGLFGDLAISTEMVNFGRVGAGTLAHSEIEVTNPGHCPFHIDSLQIVGSPSFGVASAADPRIPLESSEPALATANSPFRFNVTYFGEQDLPEEATLRVHARELDEPLDVRLYANGRECPVAVAEGFIDTRPTTVSNDLLAIPLETLYLSGLQSYDPDGEVVEYQWTVLERPDGSTAPLVPDELSPEPNFFLDLAGDYTFELDVIDTDEMSACTPALVQVTVVPDEDVHVQLVWRTPGDPNEGDENGTDLDLHLLRMPGSWDSEPWDCHWKNMEPEWGEIGGDDNPSLDIDDVDEFGPENINLNRPESGRTYAIGVYYYSDDSMGPSYATVRVFIDGVPVLEAIDQQLRSSGYFWEVGRLTWPSTEVEFVDLVHQFGFP